MLLVVGVVSDLGCVPKAVWVALAHLPSALAMTSHGGHLEGGGKVGGGGVKEVNGTHLPSFTHRPDNHGSTTCCWSSAILPIPNHTKYTETHVIKTETRKMSY